MQRWFYALAFMPALVFAHTDSTTPSPPSGTEVNAALAATWRHHGASLQEGIWQIPGIMMGGEATSVDPNLSVDDAYLLLSHRSDDDVYGILQVASHNNNSNAEIHHALAGYQINHHSWLWNLEAGRMAAAFTPINPEHASSRLFSEAPLALDAFFGGQWNDEGLRIITTHSALQWGIESWRGGAFPATDGENGGAMDLYFHQRYQQDSFNWHSGLWWFQADADTRQDQRYSSGHSHNANLISTPEVYFSGDTQSHGAFVKLSWQWLPEFTLHTEMQWMQVNAEGLVFDSTRESTLEGDYNGGFLQGSAQWKHHTFGARYQKLILENQVIGPASNTLSALAGLYNDGKDPIKTDILYRWQANDALAVRIEWTNDQSTQNSIERWAIGLVWTKNIWNTE